MRVAIVSDIHGNMVALEAVVSDMEKRGGADRTYCLGDVAAVGPQPAEVVTFLRKEKWPCVMGNCDEALANSVPQTYDETDASIDEKARMIALDRWTVSKLSVTDRRFLATFKPTIEARVSKASLLCYHGSPRSNREGMTATTPDEALSEILKGRDFSIFAGGHTHAQMFRKLGGAIVMNPGSVGMPYVKDSAGRFTNPSWAEYAMLDVDAQDVRVELCRVKYDLAALEKAVRVSGLPKPEWWLQDWF